MTEKITEYDMTCWLGDHRYATIYGNGVRWVYAAQVRSAARVRRDADC